MTTKRKKVQKVLELREQALERQASVLAQSRSKLRNAQAEAERESERLMHAAQQRAELAKAVADVGRWQEAEQWLAHRRRALGQATGVVAHAEAQVADNVKKVVAARIDKKKIELLDERLAEEQLRRELRAEQKLSDEFGQRRREDGGKDS
jgi:flagellar FliJ protein